MKKIVFFFENWFGWICLIFFARFVLYLSTPDIKKHQEMNLEILLSSAIHTKDKEIQSLVFQSVYELAKKSKEDRILIESMMKVKLSSSTPSQEIKEWFRRFQEDPYFILKANLETFSSLEIKDFQYLAFFLLLFLAFLIVFLVPFLFYFFLGKKSLCKLFGSQRVEIFFLSSLVLWSCILYFSLYFPLWLSQIVLFFSIFFVLLRMLQTGVLALFWEGQQKNLSKAFLVFCLVMASSFLPYMLFPKEKKEIDSNSLFLAIEKSRKDNRYDLLPLLIDTLKQSHRLSNAIKESLIKALGELGTEKDIAHLISFVSSENSVLQKCALEALYKILKKSEKNL